ncbi:MAG: zinc ABC transporter substrate-binding protein [Acidobacteriota bacterium]
MSFWILAGLVLVCAGCSSDDPPPPGQGLEVVATYSILGDWVRQVGGDHITVQTLVSLDSDAHTFEPTPKDGVALHDAGLIFENGLGFESWLDDLFAASGSSAERIVVTRSVEPRAINHGEEPTDPHHDQHGHGAGNPAGHDHHAEPGDGHDHHAEPAEGHADHDHHSEPTGHDHHAEPADGHDHHAEPAEGHADHDHHSEPTGHEDPVGSVDGHGGQVEHAHAGGHTHSHAHGEFDPHVWHDVPNAIAIVTVVADALAEADPANADAYRANQQRYVGELRELDAWVRTQVDTIPAENRVLVTSHESFGYFAAQYGFRTVTVLGSVSSEMNDPSAAAVVDVVEQIQATGVSAVFAENILNPRLTEQIARQSGVKVVATLYTDALGAADSGGATYIDMIRHNVEAIVEALR